MSSSSASFAQTRCASRSTRRLPNSNARRRLLLALRAPQDRLHAEQELAHAERLHDVVVGAELEADDAIDLLALRGEHDDLGVARRRVALQRLADLGARDVGQHEVEQDEVGPLLAREAEPFFALARDEDLVALLAEVVVEDLLDVGLILDDQDSRHDPAIL